MMTLTRYKILFLIPLFFHALVHATSVPNTDHPDTFVGPTLRASFTNRLVEDKAYSFAGEAGPRNYRIGATYGWRFSDCSRFKISGEYLWQNITYAFFSGNTHTWVNQGAVGLDYQYDFGWSAMHPQFDLSAYVSHAQSKLLGPVTGPITTSTGIVSIYNDERRIAGGNARGVSPALTFYPWHGSRITAEVNYDDVHYNTKYEESEDPVGLGGTVSVSQVLTNYLVVGASAAVRQPFNNYSATLSFAQLPYLGTWTVGLFGDYVDGKHRLPKTYNFGVTADYFMDQSRDRCRDRYSEPVTANMLQFVSTPAVYMPQVLAIPESLLTTTCAFAPIQYLGTPGVDPGLPVSNAPFDFSFATLFSGQNIVYSLSVVASDGGLPTDFTINPNTGLLSYAGGSGTYDLVVSGSNACSSASVSFTYTNVD